ncbi:MAG: HAD-IC family P-type ATPase [Patescibacteria group bacterium]|nr:HAD-IC family P-type ATPase [Patescibacteria group bacterium]
MMKEKFDNLSSKEAAKRQADFGKNVLPAEKTVPAIRIFLLQFANPLVYILGLAGLVSLFLQKYVDIALIFSVVIINAFMGFFQENKTQKTLTALKKLVKPKAKVLRDNVRQEIEAFELVPGDVVYLGAGDRVPADGKILEAVTFFANEAVLTGESEAVGKQEADAVFMGTIAISGRAVMRVEKIGSLTKIGEIALTLKETEQPETTLQIRLKQMTRTIIKVSIFLALLVFFFGFLTGRDFLQMAELSAVLLVAIIPEALLIVITLVLVLAMRDSLKKKALIRKISAIETLGSVTTICADKTGTLTEGIMKITKADLTDQENCFLTMCLCNDVNDTVEIALWEYLATFKDADQQRVFDQHKRVFEIPFSSEHKFMAAANILPSEPEKLFLSVKGAPEVVLSMCELNSDKKKAIMAKIDEWADDGLKVLALAFKKIPADKLKNIRVGDISGLQWGGIVGLCDPPRKEVKQALQDAQRGGLKVKVITGDYRLTAERIMERLDMKIKPNQALEGLELENLSDEELKKRVNNIMLFARVTPQQKLRVVKALQELGEIVAMTGDGVNDAPALKKSNIGIVVGDASEVAKETADLILLDNNFNTIISAVEGGRLVFENIKKIILFILSNSFAEVVAILGALLLGWPFPLTVVQILWLHILCDGPEDFILGFEPKEKETMLEGPKRMSDPILDRLGIFVVVAVSSLSGILSLGFFWYFGIYRGNLALGQTMAFMSLAFSSVIYIFSCRTLRKPFWKYENFWSNKWLFAVVGGSLFLAVIITYFPPTQRLLNLVPLNLFQWSLLSAKALLLVAIIEAAKAKIKPRKTVIL